MVGKDCGSVTEDLDQTRMGRGLLVVEGKIAEVGKIAVVVEEGSKSSVRMDQVRRKFGNPKDLAIAVRMMILRNRPW